MAETIWTPGGPHFRGKLGGLQYRKIRGKEIVSPSPDMSEVEWSQNQVAQRQTFKDNGKWAREALADPATNAAYAARARELDIPIYALVFRDRNRAPRVETIDLSGYTGKAGEMIRIRVDDPFEGHRVEISIRNAAGTVLESGPASRSASDQVEWTYRASTDLSDSAGVLVEATAKDRPGNRDSRIQVLPTTPLST